MPGHLAACFRTTLRIALLLPVAAGAALPSSPDIYIDKAARVRQALDRPWAPETGQLGNLRHLQISASDCVVRLVSGSENRVFPGTRNVIVVEKSRVLDANPDEQPTPHDVILAPDYTQACPGVGSCGLSITQTTRAPQLAGAGKVCFTVQIATAHDLLLGGDGLTVLAERLRQPALRIAINPSARLQLWLEQTDLGLLSIKANAPARVGGNGRVDFLQGSSSNRASAMYLHGFDASHVRISTTTTGPHWSIRIAPGTTAGYYQPARAPGNLAKEYGIEIDGPLERLEVPAGRVDARPLSEATRAAARSLRDDVLARAGPTPILPASDASLRSATSIAASLPRDARERVAQVVARYLPANVRITDVALWKQGGRLEGLAPDATTARDILPRLRNSGEFTYVGGGSSARDGAFHFSMQMHFPCVAPGAPSICPPGDPKNSGKYTEMQVIELLEALFGPSMTLHDARLDGDSIDMEALASNSTDARAGLERLRQHTGFFRISSFGIGDGPRGPSTRITAVLKLLCTAPPKPDGICGMGNLDVLEQQPLER